MRKEWKVYKYINDEIIDVLSEIGVEHVKVYNELVSDLHSKDISQDLNFQNKYRKFWVMRYVSPKSAFNKKYFDYLEQNKNNKDLNFIDVCKEFEDITSDEKGKKKAFQFSFITKLIHMVDGVFPIYDSKVSRFYFLPNVKGVNYDEKALYAQTLLNYLTQEQRNAINSKDVQLSIDLFKTHFSVSNISNEKILDSLVWGYVKLREKRIIG